MSNQVSTQAAKLGKLLSDPGTLGSYQQTLAVTIAILKEAAVLAWLVLCLVLVAGDWFWDNSIAAGQKARAWINSLQEANTEDLSNQVGKSVMDVSKTGLSYVVAQAREQIGLPAKEKTASASAPVSAPAPAAKPKPTADAAVPAPAPDESSQP
jgi:hypothetical protein